MDNRDKQIQMSVAYNNASRLMAGILSRDGSSLSYKEMANQIDKLARELYAKQIKALEEINPTASAQ